VGRGCEREREREADTLHTARVALARLWHRPLIAPNSLHSQPFSPMTLPQLLLLLLCTPQSIHAAGAALHGLEAHSYGSRPEPAFSFSVSSSTGSRRRLQQAEQEQGSERASLTYAGADAHGGSISFSSTSAVRPEVVSLDELPFVLALSCSRLGPGSTRLALAVAGAGGEAAALSWGAGTLLVGGPQWGCLGGSAAAGGQQELPQGGPAPFYLCITAEPAVAAPSGSFLFQGSLRVSAIVLTAEPVSLAAAFHSLDFQLERLAAPAEE
jgi:hypothetical protein